MTSENVIVPRNQVSFELELIQMVAHAIFQSGLTGTKQQFIDAARNSLRALELIEDDNGQA